MMVKFMLQASYVLEIYFRNVSQGRGRFTVSIVESQSLWANFCMSTAIYNNFLDSMRVTQRVTFMSFP